MTQGKPEGWIDELELENARIKWAFSHFAGLEEGFNQAGDHNFTVILDNDLADELYAKGWNVKSSEPLEEGDPPERHLKVKISARNGLPLIYFIKIAPDGRKRKIQIDEASYLKQIRRDTCEGIDVIVQPSPSDKWTRADGERGVSAYVKEMYVSMRESSIGAKYADYEDA